MKMHPVQLVGSMAIVLLGLGCSPGAPVPVDRAADAVDSLRTEWDMKAYQFVTLTRNPDRPDLDSAVLADIMTGHLAHLDSLYAAGIIRLVGPFGDDRNTRGLALLESTGFTRKENANHLGIQNEDLVRCNLCFC